MNFLLVAEGAVYAFLFWKLKVLCRVECYLEIKKCFSLTCVTLLDLPASACPGERTLVMISAFFSTTFPEWIPLLVFDVSELSWIANPDPDHRKGTRVLRSSAFGPMGKGAL